MLIVALRCTHTLKCCFKSTEDIIMMAPLPVNSPHLWAPNHIRTDKAQNVHMILCVFFLMNEYHKIKESTCEVFLCYFNIHRLCCFLVFCFKRKHANQLFLYNHLNHMNKLFLFLISIAVTDNWFVVWFHSVNLMASWHGSAFSITDTLWWEFTGHYWVP